MIFNLITISISYFFVMEYLIRKYVIAIDHDFRRSRIYKESNSLNTIWGDSATMTAINNLKDFINFSEGSQCYREIETKLKNYYLSKPSGGKVILQLSLNGFAPYRDCYKLNDRVNELYLSEDKEISFYMSKNYFRARSYEYLKNFLSNNFTMKTDINQVFNRDASVTYLEVYSPRDGQNYFQNKFDNNHKYLPRSDFVEGGNYKALFNIINFLKTQNVEVCLISTPVHSDFFQYDADRKRFNPVTNLYKKLSRENGFQYFDFTNYLLPDNNFKDISHLNKKGAIKFTELVEKKCFQY